MTNTAALYIRLSVDDGDKEESNSIKGQRDLLNDFIKNHTELSNCKITEFCDDGWSGTSFNRPAIKRMLEQVKNGEINCIVVKDISRFGRNYIEVGDYIEQVFPFLGVRFISVTDDFDSNKNSSGSIEIALKTLISDLYSKDLSQKVKSSRVSKQQKGECINAFGIYGYKKSEKEKNKLIIDKKAAVIVKRVFELAISGKSTTEIAQILNAQKVPLPSQHKKTEYGINNWDKIIVGDLFWTNNDIVKILSDERYTGVMISGKSEMKAIGGTLRRQLPKEKWIIVPGTHEPIVSEEEFKKAAEVLIRKPHNIKKERILYNVVRCRYCNHAMVRAKTKKPYFFCETPLFNNSQDCINEKILEAMIEDVLLQSIQKQAELSKKNEKLQQKRKQKLQSAKSDLSKSVKQFEQSIVDFKNAKSEYYESYCNKDIDKSEYDRLCAVCNKEIDSFQISINEFKEKINQTDLLIKQNKIETEELRQCSGITKLTREIVDALVEKIIVNSAEHIEIVWKFNDVFNT